MEAAGADMLFDDLRLRRIGVGKGRNSSLVNPSVGNSGDSGCTDGSTAAAFARSLAMALIVLSVVHAVSVIYD